MFSSSTSEMFTVVSPMCLTDIHIRYTKLLWYNQMCLPLLSVSFGSPNLRMVSDRWGWVPASWDGNPIGSSFRGSEVHRFMTKSMETMGGKPPFSVLWKWISREGCAPWQQRSLWTSTSWVAVQLEFDSSNSEVEWWDRRRKISRILML